LKALKIYVILQEGGHCKLKISVLMPAYNCEKHLPELVKVINSLISPESIIIVDDCSSDNTYQVAQNLPNVVAYKNIKNLGYGGTSARLYELALLHKVDLALNLHSDFGHLPENALALIDVYKKNKGDIVIGSRLLYVKNDIKNRGWINLVFSSNKNSMPLIKILGHLCLTYLQNICLDTKYNSFHEGMRLCGSRVIEWAAKNDSVSWYDYDSEFLIRTVNTEFLVQEVPVKPHYIIDVNSSAPSIRYGLKILSQSIHYFILRFKKKLKKNE